MTRSGRAEPPGICGQPRRNEGRTGRVSRSVSRSSPSSDIGDDSRPRRARRAQLPLRRRPKPVRAVHQRVPDHGAPLEPDRFRACFDWRRLARHPASDPDRRRNRCDARQARRHRLDHGGDDSRRNHHFRRSDLLADGARPGRPRACRGRLRSGGLGAHAWPGDARAARATARPQLGFRPRGQHFRRHRRRRRSDMRSRSAPSFSWFPCSPL